MSFTLMRAGGPSGCAAATGKRLAWNSPAVMSAGRLAARRSNWYYTSTLGQVPHFAESRSVCRRMACSIMNVPEIRNVAEPPLAATVSAGDTARTPQCVPVDLARAANADTKLAATFGFLLGGGLLRGRSARTRIARPRERADQALSGRSYRSL